MSASSNLTFNRGNRCRFNRTRSSEGAGPATTRSAGLSNKPQFGLDRRIAFVPVPSRTSSLLLQPFLLPALPRLAGKAPAQVLPGLRTVRIYFQRLAPLFDGFALFALRAQSSAKVIVRFSIIRVDS